MLDMTGCSHSLPTSNSILIGIAPTLSSALEIIAAQKGFFKAEGLSVQIKEYPSGKQALDDMLADNIFCASTATLPVVSNSFLRNDFKVITSIATSDTGNQLVIHKASGAINISDLKGKRIGVPQGAISEYVLDLLLLKNGINATDVTIEHSEPQSLIDEMTNRKLDAVCMLGVWNDKIRNLLGDDAIVFTDTSIFRVTTIISVKKTNLTANPLVISKLLRACIKAEQYIQENPEETFELVTDHFNLDKTTARRIWKPYLFHVSLDQSLLVDLEGLAQWKIKKEALRPETIPNYLNFLELAPLDSIDPQRVTINH